MKKLLLITLSILMLALFVSCSAEQVDAHTCDSEINEAVAPLNEELAKIGEELNGAKATNTTLSADKASLEANKSELEAKKVELEAAISAKEKEIAPLDEASKTLSEGVSALEAEIAGLKKCVTDIHEFENNVCKYCGAEDDIDATQMTAEQLNAAVAEKLATGETDIEIILAPDAPVEMFTAIRRALIDTDGVEDGSVHLTLAGVTAIPDHSEFAVEGPAIFGVVIADENGEPLNKMESVTRLASVNLPDVLSIGIRAFSHCENLVSLTAPKVQIIDEWAFAYTGLTSVDLPEATTIENIVFYSCSDITELHLPKVTALEDQALDLCQPNNEVTIYLTSADEIVVDKDCFYILKYYENLATKVNLVLHANKQSEVNVNTWTTKDAEGNEVSFTFKTITFICSDETTNHDYQYSDNGDGTHDAVCSKCGYVKVDNEKHTAVSDGYDCICGATVIAVIDGTLGGKSVATEEDVVALEEQFKAYFDSGCTTIIVTGEKLAMITMPSYTCSAVGEALYRLSGSDIHDEDNPYNGKVDLTLLDATEIAELDLSFVYALKSVTLPKVTKLGIYAFENDLYLQTITFGSVITEVDGGEWVFTSVGEEVGGCDLILNGGQLQAEPIYQPDLETNTWCDTEWKSITMTN